MDRKKTGSNLTEIRITQEKVDDFLAQHAPVPDVKEELKMKTSPQPAPVVPEKVQPQDLGKPQLDWTKEQVAQCLASHPKLHVCGCSFFS